MGLGRCRCLWLRLRPLCLRASGRDHEGYQAIDRTTASDGVERTQGFVDRVPVGVPLLAAPEEFSYQLFSLLGVAGCAKPPRTRLNLYWNLKHIDVRSFILTGAPIGSKTYVNFVSGAHIWAHIMRGANVERGACFRSTTRPGPTSKVYQARVVSSSKRLRTTPIPRRIAASLFAWSLAAIPCHKSSRGATCSTS